MFFQKNKLLNHILKITILFVLATNIISATSITTCGTISASGNYELVNDVASGGSAQCFLFTKNDTYFDCQGYNINQTVSSAVAFKYSNLHNITVKNCNITNFDIAIDAIDINNSIVQNNTIYPFNLAGISYVKNNSNQYNISILDNFISSGSILSGIAFDFSYIDNLNISNNTINNTNTVLITSTPNNLSLTNNQFSLNDYGLVLSESSSFLSSNNTFMNQTYATLTTNGNIFNSTNDKYVQQNNQLLATTNGSINYQAYITNNIIYHENSTYTNFSQSKYIYSTGNSILFDSSIPPLSGTNVSFANIHFNTSKLATNFNTYLNSTTFFWSDQQANTSNESTVKLWKYNGTWNLLNSTPNIISNEISFYNMNISDDVNSMMFLLTTDPNVFFISPTPANNSNSTDPLTQITFETNFDMNLSGNKIQINSQNYSCTVSGDLRTCTSTFAIPTLYYNETYNLVAYANKSDTIIQSQQPYSFNYFGCGYVNKTSHLISNINLNNPDYSCFTIENAENIIFDGYNYSINFFNPSGIRSGIESINSKNITIQNFEINSSGRGIYINLNNNTNLINNSLFNTTDEGLFDDGNINTSILNNTIITEYQFGIRTESSLNTTINYNHLEGYSDAQIAIYLNNQQLSNINNNYIFGFYTGLENDFSSLGNITNNIITNSTYLTYVYFSNYSNILYNNLTYSLTSIYLQNSDHINISSNLFNESTTTIDILDSTDNNINNNIIENSTINAININIASNINITSNQIINSSNNAISSLILNISNIENNFIFGKQNSNYGLYLIQFFNSKINNNTIFFHNISAVSVFAINETMTNNEFAYAVTGLFAGVLSENISIINNTIHDTQIHGFHLQNVNYTNITNITIYDTEHAFELNNSNYTFATNIYTRNATRNLLLTSLGSPTNDVNDGQSFIFNFIIDNPQGGYQNYTNISLNNTLPQDTNVSLTWSSNISIPNNYSSFKNKFIEQNGNTSLNITFNWLNSELSGINESNLQLWYNNGSWNLMNNTPNITDNTLTAFNTQNGIYAILEFIPDTIPPNVTLLYPSNNTTILTSYLNISFNATDDRTYLMNCSLYLNNTLNSSNSSIVNASLSNFDLINLSDGQYSYYVSCKDDVNNTGNSSIRTFNILTSSCISFVDIFNITQNTSTFAILGSPYLYVVAENITLNNTCNYPIFNSEYNYNESGADATWINYKVNLSANSPNTNFSNYSFKIPLSFILSGDQGSLSGFPNLHNTLYTLNTSYPRNITQLRISIPSEGTIKSLFYCLNSCNLSNFTNWTNAPYSVSGTVLNRLGDSLNVSYILSWNFQSSGGGAPPFISIGGGGKNETSITIQQPESQDLNFCIGLIILAVVIWLAWRRK